IPTAKLARAMLLLTGGAFLCRLLSRSSLRFGRLFGFRRRGTGAVSLDVGRGSIIVVPVVLFRVMMPVCQVRKMLLELLFVHAVRLANRLGTVCARDHVD